MQIQNRVIQDMYFITLTVVDWVYVLLDYNISMSLLSLWSIAKGRKG